MRQSMTLTVGALVLALAATLAFAQGGEYKIGFVNTERLFREATPAKRAQQKLEKEFAGRDADIQKLSKQVRDLQALLEKDGVTMGERRDGRSPAQLANEPRPSGFPRRASSALLRGLRIVRTIRCATTPRIQGHCARNAAHLGLVQRFPKAPRCRMCSPTCRRAP